MAKINRYRHWKSPETEILLYEGDDALKVHVVDWAKAKVSSFVEEKPKIEAPPTEILKVMERPIRARAK